MMVNLLFWLFWYSLQVVSYRLNVPRVLLPYHPHTRVRFNLVVSDPDGGCFTWRSTRPDIVSVEVIEPKKAKGCSSRADIVAVSRYAEEQAAVIFAENKDAGVILTCGATVDVINSIAISTTTKVLFLDAAPAKIVVQAFNSEGDMFSNLGTIPFEWRLETSYAMRSLQLIPFSQSKYEAPDGISELEENKKRGYVVLVEGVSSGSAHLSAKINEHFYEKVKPHEIELVVVANLLLVPSHDLYIPLGSVIHYSAEIVKQGTTEAISLPSKQYQLRIKDSDVCELDPSTSRLIAINYGKTEICLVDENIKTLGILKPPSARVYVVEPSTLSFAISGDSWYLQKGFEYVVSVAISDSDDNGMYIPENALFQTTIPSSLFRVLDNSSNGTYFRLKTLKCGAAVLKSAFISMKNSDGSETRLKSAVRGEIELLVSEAVVITPKSVVFPFIDENTVHTWSFEATGGTGSFIWSTDNMEIATVDSTGRVSSKKVGKTRVIARDARNHAHHGEADIVIAPVSKIAFGKSHLEAEIGKNLVLHITMLAEVEGNVVTVTDCRHVDVRVTLDNTSVFRMKTDAQRTVSVDGCTSVTLIALKSGDTSATISFGDLSATTYISAYSPLKLDTGYSALLILGSDFIIGATGGPRPWALDASGFFRKLVYSNTTDLISSRGMQSLALKCEGSKGDIMVNVHVGNEPTRSNPLPAVAVAKVRVCCGFPTRLALSLVRSDDVRDSCPDSSNVICSNGTSKVVLTAFGQCSSGPLMGSEQKFNSIVSLIVRWSIDTPESARVENVVPNQTEFSKRYCAIEPLGESGPAEVIAKVEKYSIDRRERSLGAALHTAIKINIADFARCSPSDIVLLNEQLVSKVISIDHGSGHFVIKSYDSSLVNLSLEGRSALVKPMAIGKTQVIFSDLCFGNRFFATVSVTDVEDILVEAPSYIKLDQSVRVSLKVRDTDGSSFVTDDADVMNMQLNASSNTVAVTRIDGLSYDIQGVAVGVVVIQAAARRTNGRVLQSQPHSIQVYAPLQLLPKVVTLLSDCSFQVETFGGPQPSAPISYKLNDSTIAKITNNGLITSTKLGYANVKGIITMSGGVSTEDSITVKVVSLTGIRIRVSTARIELGERAWARIEGLADDETPFAFGCSVHQMQVTWSLSADGIVEVTSMLEPMILESSINQFQIMIKALRPGSTTLRVTVLRQKDKMSFFKGQESYQHETTLTVIDSLNLSDPPRRPVAIRMTPNAKIALKANRPVGSIQYEVPSEFSNIITTSKKNGALLSANAVGHAVVSLKHLKDTHKEITYIPVAVETVTALFINVKFSSLPETLLPMLPLGYCLSAYITCKDYNSRNFDALANRVNYRPHRFDLIEFRSNSGDKSFEICLKEEGETIIKFWDVTNPDLNVFIRLPVASAIQPQLETVVVSEIVCFMSPLPHIGWKEMTTRHHLSFLDHQKGIAVAHNTGSTIVGAFNDDNQTLSMKFVVIPARAMNFMHSPAFITNVPGKQFVFPVVVEARDDGQTISNMHGCSSLNGAFLNKLHAPFDCGLSFSSEVDVLATSILLAHSAFLPELGSYGCIVEEMAFRDSDSLLSYNSLMIKVIAMWNLADKVADASLELPFYPRFEIVQNEIRLDDVTTAEGIVTVYVSPSAASKIHVETCSQDVLLIKKEKSSTSTLTYRVSINAKSAMLWRELLNNCNLTVKNTLTGQMGTVPVTIVVHEDASGSVLHYSVGSIAQLKKFLQSSAALAVSTLVFAMFVAALCAQWKRCSIWSPSFSRTKRSAVDMSRFFGSLGNTTDRSSSSRSLSNSNSFAPDYLSSPVNRCRDDSSRPALWSIPNYDSSFEDLRRQRLSSDDDAEMLEESRHSSRKMAQIRTTKRTSLFGQRKSSPINRQETPSWKKL